MPTGDGFLRGLGRALNPLGSSGGATGVGAKVAAGGLVGGPIGAGAVGMGLLMRRLWGQRVPTIENGNAPGIPWGRLQQRPYVLPGNSGAAVNTVPVAPKVEPPPAWNPAWGAPPPPTAPRGFGPMADSFGNLFPGSGGGAMSIARAGETSQPRGSAFIPEYQDLSERDPYSRLAYKFSSLAGKVV